MVDIILDQARTERMRLFPKKSLETSLQYTFPFVDI